LSRVLASLAHHAKAKPDHIALESDSASISYQQLQIDVATLAAELEHSGAHVLALAADNSAAWAMADLACIKAGIPLIPVPHFFSPSQIGHVLLRAGVDAVLTDRADAISALLDGVSIRHQSATPLSIGLDMVPMDSQAVALPADCAKITFTSGSTGEPKGVCLSQLAMETVAESLADATSACAADRHVSLLPYATLLENIGGLYAPLLVGATIVVPGMAAVGMRGASGLDVARFVNALHTSAASTCIMIPQMLHALIAALEQGMARPESLRYVAVGGAPVSVHLLERAEKIGLPVFEGYGLSEAGSVVAVNTAAANKHGSVGKPLPHVDVCIADDGEILVRGALFSGYLGDNGGDVDAYWPSGDIGFLDADGFLHLSGRKKHIFITAFGRNVSPEWVEKELSIEPAIAQCCVFGEACPFNVAVIVPRQHADGNQLAAAVEAAVAAANARLPDYARISKWIVGDAFSVANGLWTGTGRPRRQYIFDAYRQKITQLYQEN